MNTDRPLGHSEWVYESIVRTVPGLGVSHRSTLAAQLVGFQVAVLGLAWYYGRPTAAVLGSVGVVVSVIGSTILLRLSAVVRTEGVPPRYRELLFGSGTDVVGGLLTFCLLLVYLLVYEPSRPGQPAITTVLGEQPPLLLTILLLLILWDVSYRIGVGLWASLVGLWRSIRYREQLPLAPRRALVRVDRLTIGLGATQLLFIPILTGYPHLMIALAGYALAVTVTSGASILLLSER